MKRISSVFLILVLIFALCSPVSADMQPDYVDDGAALFTQTERNRLLQKILGLNEAYGLQIAICTTNTLAGKTPEGYADSYVHDGDVGYGDCILFLLSMEDRDWYIYTNGKAMELLTDGEVYDSAADILHHLSDGEYYQGFSAWLDNLPYYLDNEEAPPTSSLLLALVIGLAAAFITLWIMWSKMNTKRQQHSAGHYLTPGTYHLSTQQDIYLYSSVTKTPKPKNNGSSGGGRSHGGGGGKF